MKGTFAIAAIVGLAAGMIGFTIVYYTAVKPRILAAVPMAVSSALQQLDTGETIIAGIVGAPAIAAAIGIGVQQALKDQLP